MAGIPVAYPFVEVDVKPPPAPTAQRAPGVVAIVGQGAGGSEANKPIEVSSSGEAEQFAQVDANGNVTPNALFSSLLVALSQQPRPSRIYGVKVDGGDYAAGLASLEAADDVTFVSLANEWDIGAAAPATNLLALKEHVERMSADGLKRIGVAMVDPTKQKSANYVAEVTAQVDPLKSDVSRMVVVAARGATSDVATAAMAAMAGYQPHISLVLKRITGVKMPLASQYSASEIRQLSEANINPIIDPALITGESLHFAEGRCFTSNTELLYIDTIRTLDDIDFRLKAGLIGMVGDARITKSGLTLVKARIDGILGQLLRRAVITNYQITIPVLEILSLPETAWVPADKQAVEDARQQRIVDVWVTVTYGPAVHHLKVALEMKY